MALSYTYARGQCGPCANLGVSKIITFAPTSATLLVKNSLLQYEKYGVGRALLHPVASLRRLPSFSLFPVVLL